MRIIPYLVVIGIVYPVSLLPFRVLYVLSDLLYVLLYRVVGYRRHVVRVNLRNAFAGYDRAELERIERGFYRFLCDLIVESVKLFTISERALKERVTFSDISPIEDRYHSGRSIVILMGHFGNWELAGARFALEPLHRMYAVYKPQRLWFADRLMRKMRTRFGNGLYPMNQVLRGMLGHVDELTATTFIADQTPSDSRSYRLRFLDQDTTVLLGGARIAVKLNQPVIYASVKRTERGRYRIELSELEAEPATSTAEKITERFYRMLEQDIRSMPETWLWSHKRWKHVRPKPY